MERLAIISVYDKTELEQFARGLVELGVKILSTGGTKKFLAERAIPVSSISEYTGHPEILDGRVKSLHPRIHGGILARRDRAEDLKDLDAFDIKPIDFVIVNLYPFTFKVKDIEEAKNPEHESLVEFIDIGGPTMIRAAAKNCEFVVPISDPADYPLILDELKTNGSVSQATRRRLAAKVFAMMSAYDAAIARYFSLDEKVLESDGLPKKLAPVEPLVLCLSQSLRYGENPHQQAGLYRKLEIGAEQTKGLWTQLQGKEMSYNNFLDMFGALDLFLELYDGCAPKQTAVVIKHSNPCGAAIANTTLEAFVAARDCDPVSAFGGIVALSGTLDDKVAQAILEGFVEVVLAQEITPGARDLFSKKKNIRVIECDFASYLTEKQQGGYTIRNFGEEFLVQTSDNSIARPEACEVVAGEAPSAKQLEDFELAWKVCKHVKSNTIVIAKNGQAVGVGAGQMSRVDAARLAVSRAGTHGHDIKGAVAASDAFLPFPDTLEILNDAGVIGLIQPGGSIKDADVIACAAQRGVTMLFSRERHFRH